MNAASRHDDSEKHRLLLRLLAQLRCARCGAHYDPQDFVQMHRWQDVWMLAIECRQCTQHSHVIVSLAEEARPEPVIDLTEDEIAATAAWRPITTDDVLDIHLLLQGFEGDLGTVLSD